MAVTRRPLRIDAPGTVAGRILVGLALLVAACSGHAQSARPHHTPSPSIPPSASASPAGTPGALNPAVTQATIRATICVRGWTATIRPPASYTTGLKIAQLKARGWPDQSTKDYEEDHLVPLEIGGAPRDPANLWPELRVGPKGAPVKDREENALHADVCAGRTTLAAARAKIVADWPAS
jgi:hypothetical protein